MPSDNLTHLFHSVFAVPVVAVCKDEVKEFGIRLVILESVEAAVVACMEHGVRLFGVVPNEKPKSVVFEFAVCVYLWGCCLT